MKKAGLKHKPHRQVRYEDYDLRERRGVIREFSPVVVGGILLVLAFAFAGHYMGQNASAHNALSDEQFDREMAPASSMFAKGSLLPQGSNFDIVNLNVLRRQAVVEEGKGDLTLRIPVTVLTKQVEVEDV